MYGDGGHQHLYQYHGHPQQEHLERDPGGQVDSSYILLWCCGIIYPCSCYVHQVVVISICFILYSILLLLYYYLIPSHITRSDLSLKGKKETVSPISLFKEEMVSWKVDSLRLSTEKIKYCYIPRYNPQCTYCTLLHVVYLEMKVDEMRSGIEVTYVWKERSVSHQNLFFSSFFLLQQFPTSFPTCFIWTIMWRTWYSGLSQLSASSW